MGLDDVTTALASGRVHVCHRPVFVIGSPRSGTTALARALGEHSEMWTSHESYFLSGLFADGRPGRVYEKQASRSAFGWIITEEVDRDEFLAYVGLGLNALFTSRAGGRRWIDQTPMYTLIADDLAKLFPDALFLHIVRDGRRVVNSMMSFREKFEGRPEAARHIPSWAADFDASCRTWNEYVTTADGFARQHPDRCLTIVNEHLSDDPHQGFDRVFDFLGVEKEPGPCDYLATTRVNSSYGTDTSRAESWDRWPVDHRERFMEECGAAMVALGVAEWDALRQWVAAPAVVDRRERQDAGDPR